MRFKRLLSILLAVMLSFSYIFISKDNAFASSYYGNTNANIKKGGLIVKSGSYTYARSGKNSNISYGNEIYNLKAYYIYKLNSNATSKKVIASNAIFYPSINVKDGWIYYVGVSTNGSPGIYKVKTNGTKMTRITSIDISDGDGAHITSQAMLIKDNYIYYVDRGYQSKITRISISGKNKKVLSKSNMQTGRISISGDYIYFNDSYHYSWTYTGQKIGIYRMKLNGTNKKCIYSGYSSSLQYYNGYIYYSNGEGLWRMKVDGTNKKLIKKSIDYSFVIYKNKIYYLNSKNNISSMNLNGANSKTVLKGNFYHFSIYDNNIIIENEESISSISLSNTSKKISWY